MKTRPAAMTAVLLLALTGCAGVADGAGDASPTPVATASATPAASPSATATPTETPEAAPTVSAATNPEEEAYLAVVISDLAAEEPTLTGQGALEAGRYACEQIAALPDGATIIDRYNIQPLPGSSEGVNSVIVREAIANLCP